MSYVAKAVSLYDSRSLMWNYVVDNTSYAWFLSTYHMYQLRVVLLKESKRFIDDKSFFVFDDGVLIGLFPLILVVGGNGSLTYASYDDSLPFPMVIDGVHDRESTLEFMFHHFDSIAEESCIDYISLKFSAPDTSSDAIALSKKIALKMRFLCSSLDFHSIQISEKTLSILYLQVIDKQKSKFYFYKSFYYSYNTTVYNLMEGIYKIINMITFGNKWRM